MTKPKIDTAIDKILCHIPEETKIALAREIEKSYGETGNGTIQATSLIDYADQYLSSYLYDQLATVFGLEE